MTCPIFLTLSAPVYQIACLLELEPLPTTTPPASPFLSLPNPSPPPNPNLSKRSLDKALEYFHLPKDQLEASLAEAAAAYEPPPSPLVRDPNDPSYTPSNPKDLDDDDEDKDDDDKDLISQASSIIIYNGRPIEIDGRPALSRRGLPSEKKSHIGHRRKKSGPGLGLTLESTTPAYTVSKKSNERERHAPVKVQEEKKKEKEKKEKKKRKKVYGGKAMGLLEKRGRITYGWGEWEPEMQYLEALSGPAIISFAREDDLDSGAWAGEAPNQLAKDRFWRDAISRL